MEILILVIIGIVLSVFFRRSRLKKNRYHRNETTVYTPNNKRKESQPPQTFRPSPNNRSNKKISFNNRSSNTITSLPTTTDLNGLHDAFTGAPLDTNLGLYQCQSCKVYYHTDSLQVLREANNSQCVACQSTTIIAVVAGKKTDGQDYTPSVVTLQNYKQHVGSVVTFEGIVHKVNESRRGNDFAVMFENKSWTQGFKLVFFSKGGVRQVGGKPYITGLTGKTIKVRGLLIKHPKFGYEIIISQKSMILSAE